MSQDWLVRTEKNRVIGPFSKKILQEMVTSGKLSPQDEVCESTRFWIPLHNKEELLENLGVSLPKVLDEEEPQTKVLDPSLNDAVTDPKISANSLPKSPTSSQVGIQAKNWNDLRAGGTRLAILIFKYVLVPVALIYLVVFLEKVLGSK